MADVDLYASDGNIALFVGQLKWESDPTRRERLKRLLIEEVDRLGASEERLGMIERQIERGEQIVARQAHLVGELKSKGDDASMAESCLRTLEAIQDLFLNLRVRIAGESRSTTVATEHFSYCGQDEAQGLRFR